MLQAAQRLDSTCGSAERQGHKLNEMVEQSEDVLCEAQHDCTQSQCQASLIGLAKEETQGIEKPPTYKGLEKKGGP